MAWFTKTKTLDDLKKQYRELAMQHHPDVGGDTETMKAINSEYDTLYPALQKIHNRTATSPDEQSSAESRNEFYTQNGWKGENYKSGRSTTEISKILREYVKRVYPDHKFSITTHSYSGGSSINVSLMSAPYEALLNGKKEQGLNQYYLAENKELSPKALEVMLDVNRLIKSYRYDDSDSMIDYFSTNFYYDLAIGKWNKPFEVKGTHAKLEAQAPATENVEPPTIPPLAKAEPEHDNHILVLVVEPGKPPYEKRIENDFRALQQLVGGGIEFVSLPEPDCHIYCNDEGKLEGLPGNRKQDNGDILCGTFVICADDGEGNEISLNTEQLQRYKERFQEPEHYSDEEAHKFAYEIGVLKEKPPTERFVDHINANILPFIDYSQLAQSYRTEEKAYAKGILNLLHSAMAEQYGTDTLSPSYSSMEDDYAVIPGVIQGKNSGEVAIALLGIDLASSGEHCQTDILCRYGIVSQGNSELPAPIMAQINAAYMPYDYCYTANIPGDIHVQKSRLPDGIKEMLGDFQNHTAELLNFRLDDNNEEDMER